MRALFAIARREWLAYLYSPATFVVLALFLLLCGYSFWLLVEVLSARAGQTGDGSVFGLFFGGTFLFWLNVLVILTLLGMRLVAEERARGSLELLLSAPVDEWQVILGKFFGGLGLYVSLWLPTLLYIVVLRSIAAEGHAPDLRPIAAGYLGTFVVGASGLALTIAVTTAVRSALLAGLLSFGVLALALFGGALADILHPTGALGSVADYVNWFRHLEDFGRGIIDTRALAFHGSLVVAALFVATRLLGWRRAP